MTKSYNYIPTHFLYSSLLFFLLIFMYQQIHCHTLPFHFPKFFSSEFMYQPYTAPTLTPTRPASGFHKYTHPSSPRKPIHQRHRPTHTHAPQIPQPYSLRAHPATQTNPPTTPSNTQPRSTNTTTIQPPHPYSLHKNTQPHSTNTTTIRPPRPSSPRKPIHQRPRTHKHTPQIPRTRHRYHTHTAPQPHTTDTTHTPQIPHPHSPTTTQRHKRTHDAAQAHRRRRRRRRRRTDVVALAGRMQTQLPASPQLDRPGRQYQAIQNQTGQDQAAHSQLNGPGIRQAIYRIRPDQIRPSQTRPNRIRPYQTKP